MRLLLFYFILQHATLSLAQNLTINTPLSVLTCGPTLISWTGGVEPYTLQLLANGNITPGIDLASGITSTSFTWSVDELAGSSWAIQVKDSAGTTAETALFTIQAGASNCLSSSQTTTSRTTSTTSQTTSTTSSTTQTSTGTLTSSSASSTDSTTDTSSVLPSPTPPPSSSVNVKAIAIGITMASIVSVLAAVVVFIFCRIRRKRRAALEESEGLRPQHPADGSNNPNANSSMATVAPLSGFDYYSRTPVPFHIPSTSSLAPTGPNSTTPSLTSPNSTASNSVAPNPTVANPIVANSNFYNPAVSHLPLTQHPTTSVPLSSYLHPPRLNAPTPGPPAYKIVASPSEPVPQSLPFNGKRYPSDRKE